MTVLDVNHHESWQNIIKIDVYYIRLSIKIFNITHINITNKNTLKFFHSKNFLWLKNPSCKLMTAALQAVGVNDSRHGVFNLTIHLFYSSANSIKVITFHNIHPLHSTWLLVLPPGPSSILQQQFLHFRLKGLRQARFKF